VSASSVGGLDFASSQGVGVTLAAVATTGWSAKATHAALNAGTQNCAVFYGQAAAAAPATTAGVVTCTGDN